MKLLFAPAIAVTLLTGCETFFAHFNMNEVRLDQIATVNAGTNLCLAHGAINENMAFALNSSSAQLLDIVVFDRDFYKQRYESQTAKMRQSMGAADASIRRNCASLEEILPQFIKGVVQSYIDISRELSLMRGQERQQMAAMLSNFGSNWNQQSYATTLASFGPPKVSFIDAKPEVLNYLVNTSKGQIQCRITAKQYVFCM